MLSTSYSGVISDSFDYSPQDFSASHNAGRFMSPPHWCPVVGLTLDAQVIGTDEEFNIGNIAASLLTLGDPIGSTTIAVQVGINGSEASLSPWGVNAITGGDVGNLGFKIVATPVPTASGQSFTFQYVFAVYYQTVDPSTREYGRARAPRGFR